jgi:dienelactone hydrolase
VRVSKPGANKALAALVALVACTVLQVHAGPIYLFPADAGSTSAEGIGFRDPAHTIAVLYTAGSESNKVARCRDAAGVPAVLRDLAGGMIGDRRVVVVGYCPGAIGDLDANLSMAEARVPEIEALGRQLLKNGVPPRQLFVAGHSMGGWAAVLVGMRHVLPIGGVVAFAPGNGQYRRPLREPQHWRARSREIEAIETSPDFAALIYGFTGDDSAEPEDLQRLARLESVTYLEWAARAGCPAVNPHLAVLLQPCFAPSEAHRVLEFLRKHVGSGP